MMTERQIEELRVACLMANAQSKQRREEERYQKKLFHIFFLILIGAVLMRGILDAVLP